MNAVRVLTACSGRGTLIRVGLFYCDGPSRFESFVREVFVLPSKHDLILEGRGQMQIYKSHRSVFRSCPKFKMLALRVDFG